MIYVPGARARGEHVAALASKHIPRAKVLHPDPQQLTLNLPDHAPKHLPQPALSFSVEEENLVTKLHGFGVSEKKARELVKTRREAVEAQIAAYPYREEGKPRKNAAGWLIAAIEGNYTLPVAYMEEQEKKRQVVKTKEQRSAAEGCQLCDPKGWRRIRTPKYPDGAMKQCSHDPAAEAKYSDA
jgi:hypothetical protein